MVRVGGVAKGDDSPGQCEDGLEVESVLHILGAAPAGTALWVRSCRRLPVSLYRGRHRRWVSLGTRKNEAENAALWTRDAAALSGPDRSAAHEGSTSEGENDGSCLGEIALSRRYQGFESLVANDLK